MAITNSSVRRLEGGVSLRHGVGTYIATATASAAEDATFDLTQFGFKEVPTGLGAVSSSAGGAVIVGIKASSTKDSLVVAASGACDLSVMFTAEVGQ